MSLYRIDGPVLPYEWGSRSALAELLGREASGRPEAELWMGAHPGGPARVLTSDEHPLLRTPTLDVLLAESPEKLLGVPLAAAFGRLPFLLKLLAIERPLSLQAHPSAPQARAGFLREEGLGLSRGDPRRSYKDDSHKPELLFALSEVEALCGFRAHAELLDVLEQFGLTVEASPLGRDVEELGRDESPAALEAFFRRLFDLSQKERDGALRLVFGAAKERAFRSRSVAAEELGRVAHWLLRLYESYGSDPGLLAVLLLRWVRLQPGEAIFLPAQRLHAYLSGVGVEVMAASDNVLRGGLTTKHVDIAELSSVLDFEAAPPALVSPEWRGGPALGAWVFTPPVREFELWIVEGREGEAQPSELSVPTPLVLVVLEGAFALGQGDERLELRRGQQVFASQSVVSTTLSGRGRIALATPSTRDG